MILVLLSTPTWEFIPKYYWFPFLVWCFSGSLLLLVFVASTMVPAITSRLIMWQSEGTASLTLG